MGDVVVAVPEVIVSALAPIVTTLLEPVVSASSVLVWVPAALLAAAAQRDRATGPAPRANPRPARSALALVVLGLGLAGLQLFAALATLAGWAPAPTAPATWPALVACLTGGVLVLFGAVRPLLRLRRGRPVTRATELHRMHAALGTGVAAGGLATVTVALGAGLEPAGDVAGPYPAPVALVVAAVVAVHVLLRSGAVQR